MRYFAELDENNIVISAWSSNDNYSNDLNKNVIEYFENTSTPSNQPVIGYTYDSNLKAFISPQPDPTYILNTQTFEWEPDENLKYDLHGDGKLYRYSKEVNGWIPTWDPE